MCLAIVQPKGKSVPREYLLEGFCSNPHGAGFAYARKGEVHIRKGYFHADEFADAVAAEASKLSALIHFRFATHGAKGEFNCHPWELCDGRFAMIHNGILPIASTPQKSDTGHFADQVLTPALERFKSPADPALRYLVESSIGDGNKIAVLDQRGEATIYNEKQGHWHKGIWYSNHGYQSFNASDYFTSYKPRRAAFAAESAERCDFCYAEGSLVEIDGCQLCPSCISEDTQPLSYL